MELRHRLRYPHALYGYDVWHHPRYGCQLRPHPQPLLHRRCADQLPGCVDHERYRRYGAVVGYGRRCQCAYLRTHEGRDEGWKEGA